MVKLAGGRELEADLDKISLKEYRELLKSNQPQAEEDATITKVYGISAEDYAGFTALDRKRLVIGVVRAMEDWSKIPN